MGLTGGRPRYRVIVALALVVVVVAAAAGAHWLDNRPHDPAEIEIFDDPGSWCEAFEAQAFSISVEGVASSGGSKAFRSRIAALRADLFRRSATEPDTPAAAKRWLEDLADAVERGAEDGDFTRASSAARALDAEAARTCP